MHLVVMFDSVLSIIGVACDEGCVPVSSVKINRAICPIDYISQQHNKLYSPLILDAIEVRLGIRYFMLWLVVQ